MPIINHRTFPTARKPTLARQVATIYLAIAYLAIPKTATLT
ncbi:MAG: hypothetical protein VKK04_09310 [Synechococcales bacterium]|nr:hypothetical protein [Synechococcales bacterium]